MRYDAGHKARTRDRVLREAAEAIRAEGSERVGVAGLMQRAGLTHGGFYAHFRSKDALVAEAVDAMFAEGAARFARGLAGLGPAQALGRYIDTYLSPLHRRSPGRGCPMPALAGEAARLPTEARGRFGEGVASLTVRLTSLLSSLERPEPATLAASAVAELVGALALSRAVPDAAEGELILERSRRALRQRLGLEDA